MRGSAGSGSYRGFKHILLAIEELLNVIGTLLRSVGLVLSRVASRLSVLDLGLPSFNVRGQTRARGLQGGQLLVEFGLFAVDPLLLAVDDGLLSIGDALIEIADCLLLLEAMLIVLVLLCALRDAHCLHLLF